MVLLQSIFSGWREAARRTAYNWFYYNLYLVVGERQQEEQAIIGFTTIYI